MPHAYRRLVLWLIKSRCATCILVRAEMPLKVYRLSVFNHLTIISYPPVPFLRQFYASAIAELTTSANRPARSGSCMALCIASNICETPTPISLRPVVASISSITLGTSCAPKAPLSCIIFASSCCVRTFGTAICALKLSCSCCITVRSDVVASMSRGRPFGGLFSIKPLIAARTEELNRGPTGTQSKISSMLSSTRTLRGDL